MFYMGSNGNNVPLEEDKVPFVDKFPSYPEHTKNDKGKSLHTSKNITKGNLCK
jgi:hypothetical protein